MNRYVPYFVFLILSLDSNAQSKTKFHQHGIIETLEGDTIKGKIYVYKRDIILSRNRIRYMVGDEFKSIKLSKIGQIVIGEKVYKVIKTDYSLKLATLRQDGIVQVFSVYGTQVDLNSPVVPGPYEGIGTPTGKIVNSKFYLVKNDRAELIDKSNYKAVYKSYFSDCHELNNKVEKMKFNEDNLFRAVLNGNEYCQ